MDLMEKSTTSVSIRGQLVEVLGISQSLCKCQTHSLSNVKLKGLIKIESKNLTRLTIYTNNTSKGEVTVMKLHQ